jgi:serine/threonine-protein kinase
MSLDLVHVSLSEDIKSQLKISFVHNSFQGAQKNVFIVTADGKKVAIKIFPRGMQERDRREIDFYKNNTHLTGIPRIIKLLDVNRQPIVVEEYIEGDCLGDIAGRYQSNHAMITQLLKSVCDIMEPVWEKDFIHRDLKPQNIIIRPDTTPVVIDFGIYKNPDETTITETDFQPNTCLFAAPEQLCTDLGPISYRTDFFSLGIIAFYLYFQTYPFGCSKTEIITTFRNNKLWPLSEKDSPLSPFFEAVFQLKPSMRARSADVLKSRLV